MIVLHTLFAIARIIVVLVVIIWLSTCIITIAKRVVKKERFTIADMLPFSSFFEKPFLIMIISLVILGVFLYGNATFNELIGVHKPLSEREGDCVCCYYVEVKNSKSGKEYTIPAEIYVETWLEDDGYGKTDSEVRYVIRKLCFDDGSIVNFIDNEDAAFQSFTTLYDEDGNGWKCKLTERHAYSKSVQETTYLIAWRIILLISIVSIFLFNAFGSLYLEWNKRKN